MHTGGSTNLAGGLFAALKQQLPAFSGAKAAEYRRLMGRDDVPAYDEGDAGGGGRGGMFGRSGGGGGGMFGGGGGGGMFGGGGGGGGSQFNPMASPTPSRRRDSNVSTSSAISTGTAFAVPATPTPAKRKQPSSSSPPLLPPRQLPPRQQRLRMQPPSQQQDASSDGDDDDDATVAASPAFAPSPRVAPAPPLLEPPAGAVRSVYLLTDGHANAGLSSLDDIATAATKLTGGSTGATFVSVYTFGQGLTLSLFLFQLNLSPFVAVCRRLPPVVTGWRQLLLYDPELIVNVPNSKPMDAEV